VRFLFLVLGLFFCFDLFSQPVKWFMDIGATVKKDSKKLDGATVTLFKNGKEQEKTVTSPSGKFNFKLESNADYTIKFSKPGHVSKIVSVSTKGIPPDDIMGFKEGEDIFTFAGWEISLFEEIPGLNTSILNNPVAKISYNSVARTFDYDKQYSKSIQAQMTQLQDELEQRLADEAAKKNAEAAAAARADAAAKRKLEEEAKAKAIAESKAKAAAEAAAKADTEARMKAEAEARKKAELAAKAQAEETARLEAEAKKKADEEAKAKALAEAKAKAEAEAAAKAKAAEESRLKKEAEDKAKAEAAEKARLETEANKKSENQIKSKVANEIKNSNDEFISDYAIKEKRELEFKKFEEEGDAFMISKNYSEAKIDYNKALNIKPNDQTLKGKMTQVDTRIAQEFANKRSIDEEAKRKAEEEARKRKLIEAEEKAATHNANVSTNKLKETIKKEEFLHELAKKYPQGITEENTVNGNKKITRIVVVRGNDAD
jgi:hypothetical protein